jgi:AbrB family looped-hinge helix DNA binding protein
MNSIIRLDTRGRLVIPNEFRETLDLKEGDEVLMSLDTKTNTLSISPIHGKADNLIKIDIEFDDKPGSLAKLAETLAKINLDLIMTESKSFQRGAKARWSLFG